MEEQARQNSNNTKLIEEKKQVQSQLGRKKKALESIQQSQSEENSFQTPQLFHSNLELKEFSKKLEQFDSKQQEGK